MEGEYLNPEFQDDAADADSGVQVNPPRSRHGRNTQSLFAAAQHFIGRILHPISAVERSLLTSLPILRDASTEQIATILRSAIHIHVAKGMTIIGEHEDFDGLYAIVKGGVRLRRRNLFGDPVTIATLKEGGQFGEQLLHGFARNRRRASVEATEDTICIKLRAAPILATRRIRSHPAFPRANDPGLSNADYLKRRYLHDLREFHAKPSNVKRFTHGEVIYKAGDLADKVYAILQGSVAQRPDDALLPGQGLKLFHHCGLFGAQTALDQRPHEDTAFAHSELILLEVDAVSFRREYANSSSLQGMVRQFRQMEVLHNLTFDRAEQHVEESARPHACLSRTTRLNNGAFMVTTMRVHDSAISVEMSNQAVTKEYRFEVDESRNVVLRANGQVLVGMEINGDWDFGAAVCRVIAEGRHVAPSVLEHVCLTGEWPEHAAPVSNSICTCMSVSAEDVQRHIEMGVNSLTELSQKTCAGTVCGCCRYLLEEALGKQIWTETRIRLASRQSNSISSFFVARGDGAPIQFRPGQYLTLRARINGANVDRSYTISGCSEDGLAARISVKREAMGKMSPWLFDHCEQMPELLMTQAQGDFALNPDSGSPALCFAGGIGVTPFLPFLTTFLAAERNGALIKRLTLVYSVSRASDFVFKDEIEAIRSQCPSVRVLYWDTSMQGRLTDQAVQNLVQAEGDPEVYICGPDGFKETILGSLAGMGFDRKKIFVENFGLSQTTSAR